MNGYDQKSIAAFFDQLLNLFDQPKHKLLSVIASNERMFTGHLIRAELQKVSDLVMYQYNLFPSIVQTINALERGDYDQRLSQRCAISALSPYRHLRFRLSRFFAKRAWRKQLSKHPHPYNTRSLGRRPKTSDYEKWVR